MFEFVKRGAMNNLPQTMRAIVQEVYGGPEVLHFAEVPLPEVRPHDLLVKVAAVSINPVDAKVRRGGPQGQPVPNGQQIVGWDAVGEVVVVGSEARRFAVGDGVYFAGDITRSGSYAQYVAVDERIVGTRPKTLSDAEAAAVPLVALTAWEGLLETLGADRRDAGLGTGICLVVGGAGGVGSVAIQVARQVCGLTVVGTASRAASAQYCSSLGADAVIDHTGDLSEQMRTLGYGGADYIFSTADLDGFGGWIAALNPLGKICCIVGGPQAQQLDVSSLFPNRQTLAFELMFTRPRTGIGLEKQGEILGKVAALLDEGVLRPTVQHVLPWEEVVEAHRMIESGHTLGKIVMTLEP
jgi:zinc-binding alcohol dehydrogenase family protein